MGRIQYANTFGSQGANLDLQRNDLWKVYIAIPPAIGVSWDTEVQFAVQKFPFPTREKEHIDTKYLQQVNKQVGGDVSTGMADLTIRYAFQAQTIQALEKWFWLIANPITGGVGLTSAVKSKGYFEYLVPNMDRQIADINAGAKSGPDTLVGGLRWVLEGVWIKSFKMMEADMTNGNTTTTCDVVFAVDRYYPEDINNMAVSV